MKKDKVQFVLTACLFVAAIIIAVCLYEMGA